MKGHVQFLVALFLIVVYLPAEAKKPVFGNSPSGDGTCFTLSVYNELSLSGGAVGFTPQENIDLNSVTLWLADYTGYYGERIYASIWQDYENSPYVPLINFTPAVPNDGSVAAFTFCDPSPDLYTDPSGSTVLSANTGYWLVATEGGPPGRYTTGAGWVDGGTPTGDSIYNGSDNYNPNAGQFNASSAVPAFSINTVPEPGIAGFACLSLLIGIGFAYYRNQEKTI